MQVSMNGARRRGLAALTVGAAAAAAALLPAAPAEAFFAVGKCGGAAVEGSGASFAGNAQDAFSLGFRTTAAGCNGHPLIAYTRSGSGRGRGVMGGSTTVGSADGEPGVRVNQYRYGGTDEGPSAAATTNMNNGLAGTADDGKIRVIPIAAGAVAPTINYPNIDAATVCPIPNEFKLVRNGQTRVAVPNARLEQAWSGAYATWGDFLPGLAALNADCAGKPLVRVVRQDSSGTTFAWKDFLNEAAKLAGGSGRDWKPGLTSNSALNRTWPNTRPGNQTGATDAVNDPSNWGFQSATVDGTCSDAYITNQAPFTAAAGLNPVCRSGPNANAPSNGNNPQARMLKRTDGSIGYTELAAAVEEDLRISPANQDKYLMATAVQGAAAPNASDGGSNYAEPTANADGFIDGNATGGSNCATAPVRNLALTADPTASPIWNPVSMVLPSSGFAACSLTYMMVWDDYAPVYLAINGNTYDAEERKARAIKDYMEYIVSDAGQATLPANDYSPLPGGLLDVARAGVARMDWDKAGVGDPNRGKQPDAPGGGTPPAGGGTPTPPPGVVPPPAGTQPPSNAFSIASARTRANQILLGLRLPGAGAVAIRANGTYKAKVKRGRRTRTVTRRVSVGTVTVNASRAGEVSVRVNVSSAARKVLAKGTNVTVSVATTFTPQGGTAASQTRSVTLKGTKPKKKSSAR